MYTRITKLKRRSPRKKNWDYSCNAIYFITINTQLGINFFGEIDCSKNIELSEVKIKLSALGVCAEKFWIEIPQHYKNVELDEFQIIPSIFIKQFKKNWYNADIHNIPLKKLD